MSHKQTWVKGRRGQWLNPEEFMSIEHRATSISWLQVRITCCCSGSITTTWSQTNLFLSRVKLSSFLNPESRNKPNAKGRFQNVKKRKMWEFFPRRQTPHLSPQYGNFRLICLFVLGHFVAVTPDGWCLLSEAKSQGMVGPTVSQPVVLLWWPSTTATVIKHISTVFPFEWWPEM